MLFAVLCTAAHADVTSEYRLAELGMTVAIPNSLITFTRDVDPDDPNLDACGFTAEYVLEYMEERCIYLDAYNEDSTMEILITMSECDIDDFSSLSDEELNLAAETLIGEFEDAGMTVTDTDIYQGSQNRFVRFRISQPSGTFKIYSLQYFTVHAGMAAVIFALGGSGTVGGAIVFWSFANYSMLTGGKEPEEPKPEARFCTRFGAALTPDSTFCRNCGEPVSRP